MHYLTHLPFARSNRGVLIPIVVFGLVSALSIVILYNSSLRNQVSTDRVFEQDLSSFYIAEAGFQFAVGRLGKANSYAQRFYAPNLEFNERIAYSSSGNKASGYFEIFLKDIVHADTGSISIYLLSRGVYFTGKEDRFGNREKNITLTSGSLKFSHLDADSVGAAAAGSQKLFIMRQGVLRESEVTKNLKDSRFSTFIMDTNSGESNLLRELVDTLQKTSLENIDFLEQPKLLSALAILETRNQALARLSRISLNSVRVKSKSPFAPTFSPTEASSLELIASMRNEGTDPLSTVPPGTTQLMKNMKTQLAALDEGQFHKIVILEYIDMLESLGEGAELIVSTVDNKTSDLADSIQDIKDRAEQSANPIEVLQTFRAQRPIIRTVSGTTLTLHELEKLHDFELFEDMTLALKPTYTNGVLPSSADIQTVPESLKNGSNYASEGLTRRDSENSTISEQGILADPYNEPLHPGAIDKIIKQHTQELFQLNHLDELLPTDNVSDGFMKVFYDNLKLDARRFVLEKSTYGRVPTQDEWAVFFSTHRIPDRQLVEKVGSILDELHKSDQYSLGYGAHIRDLGDSRPVFTEVEWQKADFKEELWQKLEYSDKRIATNSDFLEMFRKSTWGDSKTSSWMGKDQSSPESNTNYFLRDRKSGEKIFLIDYIQKSL